MPLSELTKALIDKKFGQYCEKKIPAAVRNEVRLSYKIRGNNVTLFEERAPWHPDMEEWTTSNIAQVRYNSKKNEWSLYCRDRNSKWHPYALLPPTTDIDKVLKEIDEDPTAIFWG